MNHYFFIHTGNRTEDLFVGVSKLIEADRRPFQRLTFLIQGRGMERWMQQRLSDHFGVWMSSEFPFPQAFFDELAGGLDTQLNSDHLKRETVRWKIEAFLRTPTFAEDPLLKPLLGGEGSDKRRFQLAEQIANLFDQYQIFRPHWLDKWLQGESVSDHPHERWQMRLWQALDLSPHRGQLWRRLIEALESQSQINGLPDQVFAFGISFMPPMMLQALQALSRHTAVHLFTLSPSEDFWADLPSRRQQLQQILQSVDTEKTRYNTELSRLETAFHPLLLALGRQGAHFQHLMLEADGKVYGRMAYFTAPAENTLLAQLQCDLLHNQTPSEKADLSELTPNIHFHRCHTPLREVEVLRDRVLTLLEENPELSPNDIVVMSPDLGVYAPFIETLFADIPHTIADRSTQHEAPALTLLNDWLTLLQGRLDWDEVFGFLYQPEVQKRLHLNPQQLEYLYEVLIEQGQIRWGLSGDEHRNHWHDGIKRVLLGAVMLAPDALWQDQAPVTALEGRAICQLTPILQLFEQIEKWRQLDRKGQTAAAWAEHLSRLSDFFYGESADRLVLDEACAALIDEASPTNDTPISLQTFSAWAQSLGAERRSSAGFLSRGMTFCDLLPMRSIPVKVAFLLGMNDRSYPRPRATSDFDLMQTKFYIGDRDLRAEDRYTFLELLLSVRHRLEILWQGLSADKNELQPPAQVVLELMDVLARHYVEDLEPLISVHRSHPFHTAYFTADSSLRGRWPQDYAICQALHSADKTLTPVWQQRLTLPEKQLTVEILAEALNDPIIWALQQAGVVVPKMDSPPSPREKLSINGLDSWYLREAIKSDVPDEKLLKVLPRWQAEGRWPMFGQSEQVARDSARMVERIGQLIKDKALPEMGNAVEQTTLTRQVGDWTLTHTFKELHENGQVIFHPHQLKGKHRLRIWLSHLLLNIHDAGLTSWVGYQEKKHNTSTYYPALWQLKPLEQAEAMKQLAQWLLHFEQVLQAPPLWHADWMAKWLKDKEGYTKDDWFKAGTLACGLRPAGYQGAEPDATWLHYVRHLDEDALQQLLDQAYRQLLPQIRFWRANQELHT